MGQGGTFGAFVGFIHDATIFEDTMIHANMFQLSGLGGLIILALDIWALMSIVSSREATGTKVIWTLIVVLLPLLGFLLWLLMGPRGQTVRG